MITWLGAGCRGRGGLRYELSVSWAPPGLHESVVGTIIEHGRAR